MARRVFRAKLSVDGIDGLIQQVERYQQELQSRLVLFMEKLADIGVSVIDSKIMNAQGDSDKTHDTDITVVSTAESTKVTLKLSGPDILFIEFPTGIYYNNGVHHPKASEFGYGVGTYPGDKSPSRGLDPGYWWYRGDDDKYHFSVGTECTMPMYNASLEIVRQIEQVAKEVFGYG